MTGRFKLDLTVTLLCALVALLGMSVILGWHLANAALVQLNPKFVPMQYNTALGFVLAGAGLALSQFGLRRVTLAFGAIVFALGALTMTQYLLGVDFGIDQLFMTHYITVKTSHPGRMAPNTALSFTLTGASIALAGSNFSPARRSQIMAISGSLIMALGAVALYGYIGSLETAYGWGKLTKMAAHTSVAFMALALSITRAAWLAGRAEGGFSPQWFSAPIVTGVLTALMLLEQSLGAIHNWDSEARILSILTMGVTLGIAVSMALMYQHKAEQMRQINRQLEDQMAIRQKVEVKLLEAQASLARAQELAHLGHWKFYPETGEIDGSDEFFRIIGVRKGKTTLDSLIASAHPDDRDYIAARIKKSAETGESWDIERRLVAADGEFKWAHIICETKPEENGPIYCVTGALQDVTERKKAHDAIILAKEEAERANKAKTIFLSSISHEIRTPLTSVIGFSNLLASDQEQPISESQRQMLERISDSGIRLLGLVNNMIDLSKMESQTRGPAIELLEADVSIISAMEEMRPLAVKMGVSLSKTGMRKGLCVLADRHYLAQALSNVIENAVKYNRQGGEVILSHDLLDEKTVRISISDNGSGISREMANDLFKPFSRLGREGLNIEGAGIGLAIARRAVELMGGAIRMESEVGKGSTFNIDLPSGGKQGQMS
ncbi:MAG: PAS domain-containing protein [Nitrospinae bacterium]|nr:PAS domain-containing protein [Nitrospinota bacterium]